MRLPAQQLREGDIILDTKAGTRSTVVWSRTGYSKTKGMRTAYVLSDGLMRFVPYRREVEVVVRGAA